MKLVACVDESFFRQLRGSSELQVFGVEGR